MDAGERDCLMDARERDYLRYLQGVHSSGTLQVNVRVRFASPLRGSFTPVTRLYFATEIGWCATMRWLLDLGADPDEGLIEPEGPWEDRLTPLHEAAYRGRNDAAVILLDAGAQVDASGLSGSRPLHEAAKRGHKDTCKLLLSRGASIDVRNVAGEYPEVSAQFRSRFNQDTRACDYELSNFLAAVRAAGGWKPYVDAPRRELLALRRELPSLRERGRATPSDDRLYERLFHDARVPDDVFTHVFSYWRGPRDFTYTPR